MQSYRSKLNGPNWAQSLVIFVQMLNNQNQHDAPSFPYAVPDLRSRQGLLHFSHLRFVGPRQCEVGRNKPDISIDRADC